MNIKLLRNGASTWGRSPGALPSPAPAPASPLGPQWFAAGWNEAVGPLDVRSEALLRHLRRDYNRVRDYSDPLGTPFTDFPLEEKLPVSLWQAILRIPDEFVHGGIVLRKVRDGDGYAIRVCSPTGETIGMVEPAEELFCVNWWLERCAYWLLAQFRATPESITELLERELSAS